MSKGKKLHAKLGTFAAIPITLFQDSRVKPNGVRVYGALSSFEGTSEFSYPGYEAIAERAGLSVRAVSDGLSNLIKTGWISRKRRGLGRTNIYQCLAWMERVTKSEVEPLKDAGDNSLIGGKLPDQDKRETRRIDRQKTRASYEKPLFKSPPPDGEKFSAAISPKTLPVNGAINNRTTLPTDSLSPKSAPLPIAKITSTIQSLSSPTTPLPITEQKTRRREGNDKINIAIAKKLGATFDERKYIEYFLLSFFINQRHEHPVYNERVMKDCLERLRDNVAAWDFISFAAMANKYFETRLDCDYHLAHFTSGDIAYHRLMETECTDEYDFTWKREVV